jgi:adenine-specific DNA-methyltransferase
MSFNQQSETLLKTLDKFTDKEGILLKQNIKHHAEQFDSELIKLLLNNKTTKAHFFDAIDEATIFNYRKFIDYIDDKNFLIDSYTKFANKVGLTISNKHMQQINEVVLSAWCLIFCLSKIPSLSVNLSRVFKSVSNCWLNDIIYPILCIV